MVSLAVSACVGAPRFDDPPQAAIELRGVPFFPQTDYQCGPAALATILAHEGVPVTADDLAPSVYVEGLRGSLQAELLAGTRRRGLVPYPLEPEPAALFDALESGKPVLVLQNLGIARFPVWHYAVAVGYDPEREAVILRSGEERRRSERLRRFLRTWRRSDYWAFIAADPAKPPTTATAEKWIRALADAQRLLPPESAPAAYAAAKKRWPTDPLVLFAAAVHAGRAGRWLDSAHGYAALLEIEPGHIAARNNLANMLAETDCVKHAMREAEAALGMTAPDSPLRAAVEDTLETISRRDREAAAAPSHCDAFASRTAGSHSGSAASQLHD